MAVYGRVGIQKHGIVFTFSLHLFVCLFVLFYVCGLYLFIYFNYSLSDFKETIIQFRAFSLGERFRDLGESCHIRYTAEKSRLLFSSLLWYYNTSLLLLVIRNALGKGI